VEASAAPVSGSSAAHSKEEAPAPLGTATTVSIAHSFLPPRARRAFLDEYGPVDEGAWAFARLRALLDATALMLYADDEGDDGLLGRRWSSSATRWPRMTPPLDCPRAPA